MNFSIGVTWVLLLLAVTLLNLHYFVELQELDKLFIMTWGIIFGAAQLVCVVVINTARGIR